MRNMWNSLIMTTLIGFVFVGILISGHQAGAQTQSANQGANQASSQERKKTLSFEDELVEGSTQKPELFYLFQKKNFNYKRLIKLRENFLPEMRKTSEDLQRVRSSN